MENIKLELAKSNCRLPSRCDTPMSTTYHPSEYMTKETNLEGLQVYKTLIGILQWAVKIRRVDILLEVFLMSSLLPLPHVGHLQAFYRVFGYLKKVPKHKLYFNPSNPMISEDRFQKFDWEYFYPDSCEPIPLDIPRPRGKSVSTQCFVEANHAGDKTNRIPMTGILIFCNRAPII